MRKDKSSLERFEAGEDVPMSELAGAVVVNGCLGVFQGLLAMVAGLLTLFLGAALFGTPGFLIALLGVLACAAWWSYRLYAGNRPS